VTPGPLPDELLSLGLPQVAPVDNEGHFDIAEKRAELDGIHFPRHSSSGRQWPSPRDASALGDFENCA